MKNQLIYKDKIDRIDIMSEVFDIKYFSQMIDVDGEHEEELLGRVNLDKGEIRVFDGRHISHIWQTLFHEIIHIIFNITKAKYEINDGKQEILCDTLASCINSFLRLNITGNKFYKRKPCGRYKIFGCDINVYYSDWLKYTESTGISDTDINRIDISPDYSVDQTWTIFWHEFFHIVINMMELREVVKNEDRFVELVSVGINDVFRNNF